MKSKVLILIIVLSSMVFSSCTYNSSRLNFDDASFYFVKEQHLGGMKSLFIKDLDNNLLGTIKLPSKSVIDLVWEPNNDSTLSIFILDDAKNFEVDIKDDKIKIFDYSNSLLFYELYFNRNTLTDEKKTLKQQYKREMIYLHSYSG